MPRLKDADPRNPRCLLRIGGERWSEQDKGKGQNAGQNAEMHYATPAFSAWRQASRILAVAALCWPPKCQHPIDQVEPSSRRHRPIRSAGGLPPGELLTEPRRDDRFLAGLEVDRVDGDLVEVATLMRPLLHVDVWIALGQGHLHGVARRARPVR